ncbi:ABC transporter substrate-binding protein [Spirochaeta isovalerica]|uniref:NitT/TauT family transport system substrate-binding protein n=1 Tax=Spirochaeta isovalerica TaxID=150 RepID=A0A841RB58_9SPIO|nr:ABC transporter substrate-binding protein [Spirochaeta isovalerica]MBB6481163.1 NitT/TauT family transport system substrate-binding protein [Spirochaeta isovalerica]
MKKFLVILLTMTMFTSLFAGGAQEGNEAGSQDGMAKLGVMVQPYFNGVVAMYIRDKGWAEEAGLDIDLQVYSNGSTANEALAAGLWDLGFQGAAYVFGVINNNAKLVGNYEETRGDTLFVRADSDILSAKGFNPTYPEVYGSPDTVTGKTIIYAPGTSLHQLVIEYLERTGVSIDDVNTVPMDYQTGEQVFATGEGDIAAFPTPWSLTVEDKYGWKPIATLSDFVMSTGDLIVSNDAYENKREALKKYMGLVYRAAEELEADHDLKAKMLVKWYEENGREGNLQAAKQEAELRILITPETQKSMEYGKPESAIADFYAYIGNIEPAQADMFKKNVVDDLWKEVLNAQ